ncbi:hypothetical protein [Prosthecomicrobium sp. N25]|uniref:hypothetical protein n=1 Tax=Prosthecomicrobium sp. N25 TaxID=3129254 RepID=UPI0030788505
MSTDQEKLVAQLVDAASEVADVTPSATDQGTAKSAQRKQVDVLVDLAAGADLFHDPNNSAYADVVVAGRRKTLRVAGRDFQDWLCRGYYERTRSAPGSEALKSALGVIEAKARYDGPERRVFVRVGELEGRIYLDLGDDTWRAVEVDAAGWRMVDAPPVRFRRASGMKALPVPVQGGSIESLRQYLNVRSDADFVLVVSWTLAALRGRGPYPLLVVSGEQGSAKSTFSDLVRALVDPNVAPLRALPREERDLFVAANNSHVLAFDNVSVLAPWMSDTLCRLSTGGAFATRQLYSDQDEILFEAARPVILNGIEDVVGRPDLADRALFLHLDPIEEGKRRLEAELRKEFEVERPVILGALLDAVAVGLRRLPHTRLSKLPRMADFAIWGAACETAFWPEGTFEAAYRGNRDEAVENVLDADPIAIALREFFNLNPTWEGTAATLLARLGGITDQRIVGSREWPKMPNALSGRLRRAAPYLRKLGIEVEFERDSGRARTRTIRIRPAGLSSSETSGMGPSGPSVPSAHHSTNDLDGGPDRTVAKTSDGREMRAGQTVRYEPLKRAISDGADGTDDPFGDRPETSPKWRTRI